MLQKFQKIEKKSWKSAIIKGLGKEDSEDI